ncbi:hypothetical protein VQ056_21605 [Paenibacillus sp. JTLBN-2024]
MDYANSRVTVKKDGANQPVLCGQNCAEGRQNGQAITVSWTCVQDKLMNVTFNGFRTGIRLGW